MAHRIVKIQGSCVHLSCPNIYRYRGFTFEFHPYCGFQKVRASDYNPARRQGRKFWRVVEEWLELPPSKQKKTLIFS
ncbi:MAG TPA: hypothetical protein VIT91_08100 [Chthoniobacterales bacterium]